MLQAKENKSNLLLEPYVIFQGKCFIRIKFLLIIMIKMSEICLINLSQEFSEMIILMRKVLLGLEHGKINSLLHRPRLIR